jgi:hypothetical protein
MSSGISQRARRQQAAWPGRIRAKGQTKWRKARVINLSVTGVLLRVDHLFPLGECVEVEIDFLSQATSQTVVAGSGFVVRKHPPIPNSTAVQFETECSIARRQGHEPAPSDPKLGEWRGPGQSTLHRAYRANLARLA